MSFEVFDGSNCGKKKSAIRVTDGEKIYYGSQFMEDNGFDKFKKPCVILSYDADKKLIGFRFMDGREKYSLPICSHRSKFNYRTNSKPFFQWMRINHKGSRAYIPKSGDDGMFYIEIEEDRA